MLLKESITRDELDQVERNLFAFVRETETLYGPQVMSYNLHQVLHLALAVRRWGLLWVTSAFPFEHMNGLIGHSVHGTRNHGSEIINNIRILQGYWCLKDRIRRNEKTKNGAFHFLPRHCVDIFDEEKFKINEKVLQLLQSKRLVGDGQIRFVERITVSACNRLFTSELSNQNVRTDSSYIRITNAETKGPILGRICFFVVKDGTCNVVFRRLQIDHPRLLINPSHGLIIRHILPCIETDDYDIMRLNKNVRLQLLIKAGSYICIQPFETNKIM